MFDLDPGRPATIVECCQVALEIQEVLETVGLEGFAKTSGSKGMQLYIPLNTPHEHDHCSDFALAVAARVRDAELAQAIQLSIEYDPDPPFRAGSPETAPKPVLARVYISAC